MMEWEEIKRRLKNGATVQIVADLDGVPYKTMYNRIKWHERQDGKTYMTKDQIKQTREKKPDKDPEAVTVEDVPEIPEGVYKNERRLMPETIEEILTLYKQCCELADRYTKQAEDWARIMDVLQVEDRTRISRERPEGGAHG